MNNTTALSTAEKSAMAVKYEVLGTEVTLDLDFVKSYLVRGDPKRITDQEVLFFMGTCKMQKLNPLASGEVYLIKYGDSPAQTVIGKEAYMRRAYSNPDYIGKQDGITVLRGNEVHQREGCCLYPTEELIGGWCRVTYLRNGKERTAFKEVALKEYSSGKANWNSKPATMINKVAISQCVRDAFPKDYAGLYSEEEMIASGAIPPVIPDVTPADDTAQNNDTLSAKINTKITNQQRKAMFEYAKNCFGDKANDYVLETMKESGYTNSADLMTDDYEWIMKTLESKFQSLQNGEVIIEAETTDGSGGSGDGDDGGYPFSN